MAPIRFMTRAELEQIIESRNRGMTFKEIAKKFGRSETTIYKYLQNPGAIKSTEIRVAQIENKKIKNENKRGRMTMADKELILELQTLGYSYSQIAEKTGWSYPAVQKCSQMWVKLGLLDKDRWREKILQNSRNDVRTEQIIEMRSSGMSVADIAKSLGISRTTVYMRIKKADSPDY